MAEYTRSELHVRRVEFRVPAPQPWGATLGEVFKAVRAARQELAEAGIFPLEAEPPDDLIAVAPGDDEVIVSYEDRRRSVERKGDDQR